MVSYCCHPQQPAEPLVLPTLSSKNRHHTASSVAVMAMGGHRAKKDPMAGARNKSSGSGEDDKSGGSGEDDKFGGIGTR